MGSLRVTLLGSGSPTPSLARHQPAALVQWGDGSSMLVDAGDGVVSQILAAGVPLADVEQVAFTHLHWDQILGYPAFVWGSWCAGRSTLQVVGPLGTADMHERLVESYYRDQVEWAIDFGFERTGWDGVDVVDIEPGWSTVREGCTIETGAVVHPPMASIGYRFTYEGRSLVISGDTARCDEVIELARNADVLVVDSCAAPPPPEAPRARQEMVERLRSFHASPQECVDMAAAAGVGRVVLTHHRPDATFELDGTAFDGQVLIGGDLDVFVA